MPSSVLHFWLSTDNRSKAICTYATEFYSTNAAAMRCHTFLCLCSTHILMMTLSSKVCWVESDRTHRKLVLTYFSCLQCCMTLAEAIHTFEQIYIVFCSEYHTPAVAEGCDFIRNNVGKYNVTLDMDEFDKEADIDSMRSCMLTAHTSQEIAGCLTIHRHI